VLAELLKRDLHTVPAGVKIVVAWTCFMLQPPLAGTTFLPSLC
jgi:hypothetical protein